MNKLNIVKQAAELLVSMGTGAIVGNAVKLTTPAEVSKVQRVTIAIGSFALSAMISDAVGKYASNQIEQVAEQVSNLKATVASIKEEGKNG